MNDKMKDYAIYVTNGGDGSANARLANSNKLAEILDTYYQEVVGEGWGEGSVISMGTLINRIDTPTKRFVEAVLEEEEELVEMLYKAFPEEIKSIKLTNFEQGKSFLNFKVDGFPHKVFRVSEEDLKHAISNTINQLTSEVE